MWLLTTDGFFSAVSDGDNRGGVLVRTRARADAERLAMAIGDVEVLETPDADYRYRVRMPRSAWAAFVAAQATGIDYENFKNTVAVRQGAERARVYAEVWGVLLGLQHR